MIESLERYGDIIRIERYSERDMSLKPIQFSKRISKLIIQYGERRKEVGSKERYWMIQVALGIK